MSKRKCTTAVLAATCLLAATAALAEEPQKFTLRQVVALALQNSRELALARAEQTVAEKSASLRRSEFRPNFFTGSGAAYTNGFPLGAPTVFNLAYLQTVFNLPLRGELRAEEDRAEIRRLNVERMRDQVILRTVTACLELVNVRHSLALLRRERESAQKILDITRERSSEGLELAIEVTRAELEAARVEQRIIALEGREEALENELRSLTGGVPGEGIEVAAEELPLGPEQAAGELVEAAFANNVELKQAELEQRAREHRLRGARGGYWPTVDFVGEYGVFSRINNYDDFYRRFKRSNVVLGLQVRIPIFSARTTAAVSLAESELRAAEIESKRKRAALELEVRQQARRARELDAAREVARLELKLAQENVRILQARFEEGRSSLRDLEKARLEESDKWMAFLDAGYDRQQAQLVLLKTTGQLARIFQ